MQPMNDSSVDMASCFQIARVTRPLMSVGKMRDSGLTATFDDKRGGSRPRGIAGMCI